MIRYIFEMWEWVYRKSDGQSGQITNMVPGDGTGTGWYEFTPDDGSKSELVQADDLDRA